LFCKHDYKLVDKTETPSPAERMRCREAEGVSLEFFQRKITWFWKCKKCNHLRREDATH
jgi:hypothetical protein